MKQRERITTIVKDDWSIARDSTDNENLVSQNFLKCKADLNECELEYRAMISTLHKQISNLTQERDACVRENEILNTKMHELKKLLIDENARYWRERDNWINSLEITQPMQGNNKRPRNSDDEYVRSRKRQRRDDRAKCDTLVQR